MSWRQPVNIPIHRPRTVSTPLLQEKIAYELRIEIRRDAWHLAENFERIAEIKTFSRLGIKKRAYAQQISHAPEATLNPVP